MATEGIKKHEGNALNRDFILMTIPLFIMACFFYGPRVLLVAAIAVITARLTDRLAARLRGHQFDSTENSSTVLVLVLVLMLPATVKINVVVASVLVTVLVAKEAFGGYRSYPFNPSAVGFCVAAVSWPDQVLQYPAPTEWFLHKELTFSQLWSVWSFQDVVLAPGPSAVLRTGGLPKIDFWNLLLGNYASPMGVGCTLVIMACALYLIIRKRIPVLAPLSMLGTVAIIAFVFPRYSEILLATWPQDFMLRLQVVKFEGLSGAMVFAAIFLLGEPGTLPKNTISQVIYGVLLGLASMLFRYFGTYELGACFGLILVNAMSGYFDRAVTGWSQRRAMRKGAATQ